jgi:hypothetical protein
MRRNWRLIGLILVLMLIALLTIAGGAYRFYWNVEVGDRKEAVRRAGYPITLEELDAWYARPSGKNAAPVYQAGFDAMTVPGPESGCRGLPVVGTPWLPKPGERFDDAIRRRIAEYLDENRQALDRYHEAAAIRECRYPVDLSRWRTAYRPAVVPVRIGGRLLVLEAAYYCDRQDAGRTLSSLLAALAMARSLEGYPSLGAYVVRSHVEFVAISGMAWCLGRIRFDAGQLAKLWRAVDEGPLAEGGLERALVGERCLGNATFDGAVLDDPDWITRLAWSYGIRAYFERDHALYLDTMSRLIEAAKVEPNRRIAEAWTALDEFNRKTISGGRLAPEHALSAYILPVVRAAYIYDVRRLANGRAAQLALIVEQHRLATGALPDSLARVAGDVPIDPFNGRPMRYRRLERGFLVYSVGYNRRDDGGDETPDPETDLLRDVVLRVER